MKKLTHGLGVLAIGIISTTAFSGCSSPADPAGAGGTGSTGGTGNTAGGPQLGVQVNPPGSYIILSATDAMPGPTPAPPAWSSATCSTCHGSVGQGVQSLAPEIRHVPAAYAQQVVRQGRKFNGVQTGMVAFPMTSTDPLVAAITDADLTAVISWLDAQPKPTTPSGLFLDFCGNCHGKDGNGGIQPVKVTGEPIATVNMKVRTGVGTDISMRNAFMPPEDATALTDAELALIEQFIMAK
jgi:mono/diheme cytochrome c family protein